MRTPLESQVNRKRNEIPADGKPAVLEELVQPLLGLFAQFHHGNGREPSAVSDNPLVGSAI